MIFFLLKQKEYLLQVVLQNFHFNCNKYILNSCKEANYLIEINFDHYNFNMLDVLLWKMRFPANKVIVAVFKMHAVLSSMIS